MSEKVHILAIGVHPDDVELSCSGTLLKHLALGYSAAILDLTEGELGTRGTAAIRLQEANAAAGILGITQRVNIGIPDGFFEVNEAYKKRIISIVRRFQPEVILANAIDDRHPDHGRSARLIYDSCFLAGLHRVQTFDDIGGSQTAWRPRMIYNYIQDKNLPADLVIDITPFMDRKMESILAFRSQFFDPESKEPDSPISGRDFLEFIKARARVYGRQIGVEYGEGFTIQRPLGIQDLLQVI